MVYLNSLLPNPDGPDAGNEWISLINDGSGATNLYGWRIEDSSGATFRLSELGFIQPAESVKVLPAGVTLNNDGDKIILYDNLGTEIDRLEYGETTAEGEIVFSQKAWAHSQTNEIVPLANILETGIINPSSPSNSILEPVMLGLLTAALGTAAFVYVWRKIYNKHE